MTNFIRIGILSQPVLPEPLEPLVQAILREQFRKLGFAFSRQKVVLIGSIEGKAGELACAAALDEGLNLELEPFEASAEPADDAAIMAKIQAILEKQPQTTSLTRRIPEKELLRICAIIISVFDKSDLSQATALESMKKEFFENDVTDTSSKKLLIEVNAPMTWTPEADGEVYFEYITKAPGQTAISSEIEIPDELIQHWKKEIANDQH